MAKCKGIDENGEVCGRPCPVWDDYCRNHRTQDPSVSICMGKLGNGKPCFREAMRGELFCRGHRTQLGDIEKLQCPRGCGQLIYRLEYKNGYYFCQECKGTMLDAKSVEKEISKHVETLKDLLENGEECSLKCPRCEALMLEIRVTYKLPEGGGLGGGLGGFGGGGGAGILLGIAVLVVVAAAAESAASSKSKGTRMVIDGCRDCGTFWFDASEMKIVKQSTSIEGEDVEIARMEAESGEKNIGSYAIANCLHIDDLTDKKCRRVTFRGTGYCYRHQPE
jgi:Zn-finger nucleic acid-binding protein